MSQNSISSALSSPNVGETERMASITIGSALLANALTTGRHFKLFKGLLGAALIIRGASGYCPAYGAISRNSTRDGLSNINIRTKILVNKDRQQVYTIWRRLENLPVLMKHLDSVKQLDNRISEWKLKVPAHLVDISWKSEIVKDEPGELIGWQSLEGAGIHTAGKVEFKDAPDGQTEIDILITYHPPFGKTVNSLSRLFTPAFRKLIHDDIKNFKHIIETSNF